MAALLRKYDRAKVFGIEISRDKVTFTVDTGMCYMRSIPVVGGKDIVNINLTILFSDIAHFIPTRTDVTLDITEYYMCIVTQKSQLTLQVGESIVAPYVPRKGTLIDLDYGKLRNALRVFNSTVDLQKAYSRDFAITLYGDWALLKSPTVWIRTRSHGLKCILSLDQLKSIVTFQPEFVEESDRLEFHKGDAILSLPRLTPTESDKFVKHVEGMRQVSTVVMQGVVKELLEVKRAIGVAEAEIHLHEQGFYLKITKGGISLEESYNRTGNSVFSFRYMLDIFIMCLNILGEDTEINIYVKEGLVCLESTDTSILISV
jgi:hypothetical protein